MPLPNFGLGPIGPRAATTRPTDQSDAYGQQTWFTDATGAGKIDGTTIQATFLNQLIGLLVYLSEQTGVPLGMNVRNDPFLYRAIASIAQPSGTQIATMLDNALGSAAWRGGSTTMTGAQMVAAINTQLGSTAWQGGGTGVTVTTAAVAPASPTPGDLWFNTADDTVYVWINSGGGLTWIDLSTVGAGGADLITVAPTAPASPNLGQQWWNTTDATLYEFVNDGTSSFWISVS